MKELLTVVGVAGLVFLLAVPYLVLGVIKQRGRLIQTALWLFVLFVGVAGWAGFRLVTKSYHKLAEAVRPRTGDEIYAALFGKKQAGCVKVLHYQDQVVPKIDYAIWLHFETCPKELKRILALHDFAKQKQATLGWQMAGPAASQNWFKLENLGDSVVVFTYRRDDYGSGQTLYVSADGTQVFCVDASE